MPFDWDSIDPNVDPALVRLAVYNSSAFNASTNPYGLGAGGHIVNFPLSTDDVSVVANAFPEFADLMSGYADAASASATSAATAAAKLSATSTSSQALSTAEKTFTTQSGKQIAVGDTLLASSDANPTTHWVLIRVTSYSSTTLIGDVLAFAGSGSRADWTIRHSGVPGTLAGLVYKFSTSTSNADPTTGTLAINHGTPGSATALYISETDFFGTDISAVLARWGTSTSTIRGRVTIQSPSEPTKRLEGEIVSNRTDNGAWDTFTVQNVTGSLPTNGGLVVVSFTHSGDTGSTGSTGATGDAGATGATGQDGGIKLSFNSATSGDPASGKFLFNHVTFASATAWHVSETDGNSNGIGPLLAALDNGGGTNKILVVATAQGGAAYYSFWVTAALSDQGAYDTFAITPITTSGSIANNDAFHFLLIPLEKGDTGTTGSTGATGPLATLSWTFDGASTADSDPGSGKLRFNHATYSSVTSLFFDNNEAGGASVTAWLDALDDSTNVALRGILTIIEKADPTKFAVYSVSGAVTDGTGYRKVAVTHIVSNGTLTDTGTVGVNFSRTGNKGSDGAGSGDVVGPASATDIALARFNGTDGKVIQDSAVALSATVLAPATDDAVALGSTAKQWSDLFMATGGVINFNNGNWLATHSSGILTVSVGDIRITAAGTNAASTVTVGGAQTLTNKTLTSPVVNTPTGIVKGDVGLGNVDNTSDAGKPVATAQAAINDIKRVVSVRAATTANITIATALNNGDSLDGVTLATGDLVLVKDQTSPAENGIIVVGVSPARHGEFDAYNDHPGTLVTVQEGTAGADTTWLCTSDKGGTIDSTALTFVQQGAATAAAMRTLLGVGTGDSPQFTAVNIGAASDTTVTRTGAGDIAVEGNALYRAGGTDVPVTDGGTGASTAAGAATNLGLGTGDSPQFTGINVGNASDTTITRDSAGVIAVEGVPLFSNIPQNSKSAAYTTVLADAQKHIFHPSADTTARTWTIDSNANVAYPIGTAITFINQNSGGVITIAITSDTMRLAGAGTTGSRTLAANGIATAIKVAATEWIISGTGLT